MPAAIIIFVTGPPASGKTAVANHISYSLGHSYISPADQLRIWRDEPTPLGSYIRNNYNYECLDPLVTTFVFSKVSEALFQLPNGCGVVVDGFPRTAYQASALEAICQNTPFLVLNVAGERFTRDESIRRTLSRQWQAPHGTLLQTAASVHKHHAATPDEAGRRYDVYDSQSTDMLCALKVPVCHVDASLEESMVLEQCLQYLMSSPGKLLTLSARPHEPPRQATSVEAAVVIETCMRIAQLPDNSSRRFVGSHPVSLQRKHFSQLTRHPYMVSRKMNGERALLLILNGRIWMLRRNFEVIRGGWNHYLQVNVTRPLILDAEWVEATKTFCIIDVPSSLPLLQRIHTLSNNPLLSILSTSFNNCRVYVQRYFAFPDFRMIEAPQTEELDGYIFTPQSLPYRYGRDSNMFKAKELKNNTADLLVGEDGISLYVKNTDRDAMEHVGRLVQPAARPGLIVECTPVDSTASLWAVQRVRGDKLEPNESWVYHRVVESIREDIKFSEISDLEGVR